MSARLSVAPPAERDHGAHALHVAQRLQLVEQLVLRHDWHLLTSRARSSVGPPSCSNARRLSACQGGTVSAQSVSLLAGGQRDECRRRGEGGECRRPLLIVAEGDEPARPELSL